MDNPESQTELKSHTATHYIFRWRDGGIYVTDSRRESVEEVWEFAIQWLRPANMPAGKKSEKFVREFGEVVKDDE